jgi:hypothetical protein
MNELASEQQLYCLVFSLPSLIHNHISPPFTRQLT